ncbi:rRNA maturation RNase YbeY [Succinimonas sp.]|uniref:rRNA maturation RNase YbeY n=1 Tax=Succinimonas sp. TaxID=1936151 RepID=UPI0038657D0B
MITIDYQIAVKDPSGLPEEADLVKYAETAAQDLVANAAMTVRIAEEDESHALNMEYRHVDRPTNVLSFPYELPEDLPPEAREELPENYLGDLVICKSVVEREAREQNKTPEEHWAHMVVHGTLHLLGFDHITDEEALEMETRETAALRELGFPDPYQDDEE